MDNGTHSLLGAALAKTRLGRLHKFAPLSLLVGANLPDADVLVSVFGGKNAYLFHHRGLSHSLAGIVVEALLLALIVRAVERWRARAAPIETGDRAPLVGPAAPLAPPGFVPYLLPAAVGLLSHPLLDSLNTFGVRPWLPFSDARYFGDLVFIVDPWMWCLFGGMALLSGARSRLGNATWLAVAVAAAVILYTNHRTPIHVEWGWPIAVAALALLRWRGFGERRPRLPLLVGGALTFAYLGGLELAAKAAVANALRRAPGPASVRGAGESLPLRYVMRSPAIANPFEWTLYFETDEVYRKRNVRLDGAVASDVPSADDIGKNLADPRVRRALELPEARGWRRFARLPTAWTEKGQDGSDHVFLSDARYQWGRKLDWCVAEIDLPP